MGKNQQDGSQIKITGWWLLFPSEKYDFVRQLGLLKKTNSQLFLEVIIQMFQSPPSSKCVGPQ